MTEHIEDPGKGSDAEDYEPLQEDEASQEILTQMQAEAVTQKRAAVQKASLPTTGVGVLRRSGATNNPIRPEDLVDSDIPYPKEVHGEDFELYSLQGFAAYILPGTDIEDYASDQQFIIDPAKVQFLKFDRPGRPLGKAQRAYVVKHIKPNGIMGQTIFEAQVNNSAAGDRSDAIGLWKHIRKGFKLLIDIETLIPIYCAAVNCWAQAVQDGNYVGFCTMEHAMHTMPNDFKGGEGPGAALGMLQQGVTTRSKWGAAGV